MSHRVGRPHWVTLVSVVVASLVAAACSSTSTGDASSTTSDTAPASASADHAVEVVGGHGSGRFRPGETVHVWSAVSPMDEVVEPWKGDAALLEAPGEWRTSFVMPDRDVTLVANSAPATLTLVEERWEGATGVPKEVRYFVPPSPRGLVLFSHGTSGSSRYIEGVEAFAVALALVEAGFGVVAADAEEVAAGDVDGNGKIRWDTRSSPANDDLRNIAALFDDLELRGIVPPDIPKFAMGMSNGGAFSHFVGTVSAMPFAATFPELRFEAVVSYCADASGVHARTPTTTPSAWFMCGAEDNPQVFNEEARATERAVRARGVITDYAENPPTPLFPERFTRVPGVSPATSTAIHDELREAGVLDPASGSITVDVDDLVTRIASEPAAFPVISAQAGARREIRNQLKVTRAEHSMYSDLTRRTVDFFDQFVLDE